MRKIVISLLSASLAISSQITLANENSAAKLCPTVSEIKTLALTSSNKSYVGKDRYTVTSDYRSTSSYNDATNEYKSLDYTLKISGVKGKDAEDALKKVKTALASAAEQHPNAISLSAGPYEFQCIYALDFSKDGDDYNDIYPTAIVEIHGSDFNNLSSTPPSLNTK